MRRQLPEPAVGQRWALRDLRYDGMRYLTVTNVTQTHVLSRTNTRTRRSRIRRDRFGRGSDWAFCGYDGPGVLPPFTTAKAVSAGCGNCPPKPTVLPTTGYLNYGGMQWLEVTCDGEVWFSHHSTRIRLAWVEKYWVPKRPDGDWRIRIESMLSEQLYQRQDPGWVLVAIGMGIA